jgi:hypothetical protein
LFAHDLSGKPLHALPDHALATLADALEPAVDGGVFLIDCGIAVRCRRRSGLARTQGGAGRNAARFGAPPDDCAVPALLVPGGGGELFCASEAAGPSNWSTAAIKAKADILVIAESPSMIQPAAWVLGSRGNA